MEIKLEIELPNWTDDKRITVVAGNEPVYFREIIRHKSGKLEYKEYLKSIRCNFCGKCCMNLHKNWPHGVDKNGTCLKLTEGSPGHFYCDPNKGGMPFDCLRGDNRKEDYCCVEYKEL